jgi:hypothetical protein
MEIQDTQPIHPVQSPPPPANEPERPVETEAPSDSPPLPEDSATILDLYA